VAPRSAGPKKLKQKKQPTLWGDEAEDDDENGVDEDREKEPDSEDERFIDDASEQSERNRKPEIKHLHRGKHASHYPYLQPCQRFLVAT